MLAALSGDSPEVTMASDLPRLSLDTMEAMVMEAMAMAMEATDMEVMEATVTIMAKDLPTLSLVMEVMAMEAMVTVMEVTDTEDTAMEVMEATVTTTARGLLNLKPMVLPTILMALPPMLAVLSGDFLMVTTRGQLSLTTAV